MKCSNSTVETEEDINLSGFLNITHVFVSGRKFNLLNFLDVSKGYVNYHY